MRNKKFPLAIVTWLAVGLLLSGRPSWALEVNLTEHMPYLDITYEGKSVRIQRIQDTSNVLDTSFAKTSRPCPPFCIHPMKAAVGVETVSELELLDFMVTKVRSGKGILVDARVPEWYQKGTIPGAVNIPWMILTAGPDNPYTAKILRALDVVDDTGQWDFRGALEILLFCNGPWCDQSPRAIKNLIALGYPPEKLYYYRGGMQVWQLLGLTTIIPEQ
jgi:rhodanese-related sulfurtransferase